MPGKMAQVDWNLKMILNRKVSDLTHPLAVNMIYGY